MAANGPKSTSPVIRWLLPGVVIGAYAVIATLYAALTPDWQVPDEPAHYNYVAQIVAGGCCPVIEPGDYDQPTLNDLTASGFPENADLTAIEYEDHQPPLYYLAASLVFRLAGGDLLALRLFSVLLGAGALALFYVALSRLLPAHPELALAAVAFVAFVPQHVAMLAGVNNDSLAELVLGLVLLALLAYAGNLPHADVSRQHPALLGGLAGLAFLTKATVYAVTPPLVALAIFLRMRREGHGWRWFAGQAAWAGGVALLVGGLWAARGATVYGWPDVFGLATHDAIATSGGQLRTVDFVAQVGLGPYLQTFLTTTFHSFWGQFGWMGVPMPPRIYLIIGVLSVWVIVGFCGLFFRFGPRFNWVGAQRDGLSLLVGLIALVLFSYIAYNLTFYQAQGRYLFGALPALGLGYALGIHSWSALLTGRWPLARWLPLAFMALLTLLDVWALFRYIIPYLD